MQEDCYDYYLEEGCCLECVGSEKGCLCYDCKCTKCYWYSSSEESFEIDEDGFDKGSCDKKYRLIRKRLIEKSKLYNNKAIDFTRIGLLKEQSQLKEYQEEFVEDEQ